MEAAHTERAVSDVAFSPTVKAIQQRLGSRRAYEKAPWPNEITPDLAAFIAAQTSFFMATASADGQPYIQHRGGPPGFLHVVGTRGLAFADFSGNRQYISLGNLTDNPKVCLFLIDYAGRQRIKIWGRARMVEDDAQLLAELMPKGYKARGERVVLIEVEAWNANCPQHIPQRFEAADVAEALIQRDRRIAELEAQIDAIKHGPGAGKSGDDTG